MKGSKLAMEKRMEFFKEYNELCEKHKMCMQSMYSPGGFKYGPCGMPDGVHLEIGVDGAVTLVKHGNISYSRWKKILSGPLLP